MSELTKGTNGEIITPEVVNDNKIKISHGEVTLRSFTRKLKKKITKSIFVGQGMDVVTGEFDKVPMGNLLEVSEEAFKVLCEKITIEGKDYKHEDLEKLEKDGKFLDADYEICEEACVLMYRDTGVKKN